MSGALRIACPAKVNLSLRILGRREDGFHELDTVFQAIDLWDEIVAHESDTLTLTCDDPSLPTDASNLVLRAAERLRDALARDGIAPGARLELAKRIPAGAGLGGGSSDAAGTLVLLSRLWRVEPSRETLEELARGLGADVAFFLQGGTARGTGRGDRIEPLPFVGPLPILLGVPPFPLATAQVYRDHANRLTLPAKDVTVRRFSYRLNRQGDEELSLPVCNDLEGVVFASRPELAGFRDALEGAGARLSLLSGSGSTVFGVFDDPAGVAAATRSLAARFSGWRLLASRAIASGVGPPPADGHAPTGLEAGS